MAERFKVQEGSQSFHCCFEWSVLDTHDVQYRPEGQAVCECFEHKDALAICAALNQSERELADG